MKATFTCVDALKAEFGDELAGAGRMGNEAT